MEFPEKQQLLCTLDSWYYSSRIWHILSYLQAWLPHSQAQLPRFATTLPKDRVHILQMGAPLECVAQYLACGLYLKNAGELSHFALLLKKGPGRDSLRQRG